MADPKVDLITLRPAPLDPAEALAFVASPDAGGTNLFIGTTRAETHPQFGDLLALDYDAYEEMAVKDIARLIADARAKFGVLRAAVLHRTGRVTVGEASVVIAVSCPHRGEAFAACRFLIDELKKSSPIWKRDIYRDAANWKHD